MARARAGRWGRAIVVAALGALGAACTLLTSLNGLTGGGPGDGGSNDAPAIPDDSGGIVTPDAGAGEDASDAAPPDDALALDAPEDAIPSAYCASLSPQPVFCVDFDEDPDDAAALTAPWDQVTGTGGTVARSGGIFTSPSLAMLVTTTPDAPSIDLCGYKTFGDVVKPQVVSLAFDMYVVTADTSAASDAVLSAVEFLDTHGHRWALQLEVVYDVGTGALDVDFSQNGSVAPDASTKYLSDDAGSLPIGAWTRVTMEVTIGSPYVAALHFGSTQVASIDVTPQMVGAQHPEILVGGTYAVESPDSWVVRYDDVVFDVP